MRHEIIELDNLLNSATQFARCQLGIPPIETSNDAEYILHLMKYLPKCVVPLPRGGIFRVREETLLKHKGQLLCLVGGSKVGNAVLYIDHDILTMERTIYRKLGDHIDLIRCIRFSDQMKPKLRGHLGELFKRYRNTTNELILDNFHVELQNVSYLRMVHEYMLTGKMVDYNETVW